MPSAREYRHPITIKNADGSTFAHARAAVTYSGGTFGEDTQERKISTKRYKFEIRYLPGLSAIMSIDWNGRVYEITAPPENVDDRNRVSVIEAEEEIEHNF